MKRLGKRENKNYRSAFRSSRCVIKNSKKITKKLKKIKKYPCGFISNQNTLQKGCKREKIKIILPFHSYSTRDRKFQKNSKKIQKIKRYHYGFISSFLVGKIRERGKIKIIVPFCSYPMHNGKFQKNSKKIKKYHYDFISIQNRLKKTVKERKQKLSFHSIPTRRVIENSKKIAKKLKKYHYGFISSFLVSKVLERGKIKIIVPFCSYPMHNGKFQKNSQNIKNIKKKIPLWLHFKLLGWKSPRTSENKNYRSVSFLPDA